MIPSDPGPADPVEPPAVPPAEARPPADPPPARPGASTFTIEGRAAPALFVVGWLATLIGFGAIFVALLAGGTPGAAILLAVGLAVLSIGLVAGAGAQGIERRSRADQPYTGPSPILVFVASVPVSLLAVVVIAIPLTIVGIAVDGPVGRLASVAVQAVIYVGLIRLLVVDTGALSWAEMGLRRLDRRALGDLASGALWAGPVILVTIPVAAILSAHLPRDAGQPIAPDR